MKPTTKAQGSRLRQARKEAGYKSARSAALENGWAESSYRAHESGTRTIGQDDAEAYAKAFRALGARVSAKDILFPDEPPPTTRLKNAGDGVVRVPLISWVSAGRLTETNAIPLKDAKILTFGDLGPGDYFALRGGW